MRYIVDHDFHIHSQLSLCSDDPLQTKEAILRYAVDNGLKKIVVTDHYWDAAVPGTPSWYPIQNYEHVSEILPLPQAEGVQFKFGCETEISTDGVLGISREAFDRFDFVIIPTTHLHMPGFEEKSPAERKDLYVSRFARLLDLDLPFSKIGIAHLTCPLIAGYNDWAGHLAIIDAVSDDEFRMLFSRAAEKGMGIELNIPIFRYQEKEIEHILRPYRMAKECGCKFYFGSDAHHPAEFAEAKKKFERITDLLELEETDKFDFE